MKNKVLVVEQGKDFSRVSLKPMAEHDFYTKRALFPCRVTVVEHPNVVFVLLNTRDECAVLQSVHATEASARSAMSNDEDFEIEVWEVKP